MFLIINDEVISRKQNGEIPPKILDPVAPKLEIGSKKVGNAKMMGTYCICKQHLMVMCSRTAAGDGKV